MCTPQCTPQYTQTLDQGLQTTEEHFKLFDELKMEVSKMEALPYFDVNAETTLQTDASKRCLGASP